ncbi:MAG: HYR domain-containing protein, partial [Bacteroidetes bacterium]|nr:HYR domain-containing protein [Bacteroidota bacterium]
MKRLYRFFFHLGIWMLMALSGIGFLCAENPGCTNLTGFNLPPDLCALSNKQFNAIAGNTSTSLNFSWTSADSLVNLVSDLGFLRIAAWDGNNWVNIGQSAVSGNLTAGFITTNPVVPNNYFLYKFAAAKPEVFGVTGGGAYCALTDAGVPIGLNGSQIGVNYQLKINNNDVGLPVSGTGNAISFGNQKTLGSYSVVASMGSAACMVYMNGLATVNSIVCEANISDPCSCKNNATTLSNGQFDETVQVNAPANQSWTVTAVNGLYLGNSPAPPASPIAIPLGTPLTYIGSNTYQIKGIHVDAIGYSITVSNGQGTSLSIGNTCAYPNPSFIPNLDVPFCLYSNPITLSGNPGDNNILSQNFTINGVSSAIFNPGAGLGAYTLIYTVNGGSPKAFGPNDPGCIQSIEKVVNVVSTPSALFCNDQVNVSIDADCNTQVLPDDVLEGSYGCLDDYLVELDRNAPFGNGPWTNSTLTSADIGKTYQARVTHLGSGNYCYGLITVEDKLPPVLTCSDITLFCPITNYDPNYLKNTLGINTAFPTVSDCSNYTLTYVDTWNDLSCGKGFNGVSDLSAYVVRKWTAKDAWNNSTSCIQYLYFKRLHISDVLFPADYTVSCSASNTSTDPLVTGAPYFLKFGLKWPLNPDPGFCEMQAIYNDQYLVDCEGSYSVVRTWTVIDWCLPTSPTPPDQNPITFIQQIKVVDNTGPNLVCPANLTVSVDDNSCCGTINLPDVVLTDNCSRINSVSAMVTTFDLYTNQQTGMYTVAGSVSDFPGNDLKLPDTLANYGYTPCLPLGTHTVVYVATDDCGNTKTCSFKMKVDDLIPPVPVCDQVTQVALNTNGQAVINATTFDDGSYDNCGTVYVKVGRLNSGSFSNTITFSCSDITPNPINIVLRVYDVNPGSGSVSSTTLEDHANDCMAKVQVVDKIKPVCTPPPNLTLTCELFDPTLTPYGKASVTDNCCLNNSKVYMGQKGLSHSLNYTLFDTVCNRGTLIRNFTAYDCYGQTSTCSQRLVVDYTQDYLIRFPNDVLITACDGTGNYGTPVFFGEDCELLGVSFEDQVFTVVPDACFKIERSWTIINWCTFNPNLGCINVPNPNPNPIENHPSNFPGPIVSPLGTAAPWAPTIVKINPGDAQATNYSSFYASNANCYKYKQIIKIADLQDP